MLKYCNRCFRNIFEDVNVCPHCGLADKLIDYDKERQSGGEAFTCNTDSTLSSHIKKDDAYSVDSEEREDAYGNEKRHDLDHCENSNDNNAAIQAGNRANAAYLRSLSPLERRKLVEEKQAELRRRYGMNPSEESTNGATIKVNGIDMSVDEFRRLAKNSDSLNSVPKNPYSDTLDKNKATAITMVIVIAIILFMFAPGLAFALIFFSVLAMVGSKKNDSNGR